MRAFYVLIFESAGAVPSLTTWTQDWIERCQREAQHTLKLGQQAGTIDPAIDPRTEAEQFVLAGLGLGFRWTFDANTRAFSRSLNTWRKRFDSYRVSPK